MIFSQFFDEVSSTYTYLLSSGKGREALIIDPVLEKTDEYISCLKKRIGSSNDREILNVYTRVLRHENIIRSETIEACFYSLYK